MRFCNKGKLSPGFVGPYEILQRFDKVAYELRLPSEISSFHPFSMYPFLRSALVTSSLFFQLNV